MLERDWKEEYNIGCDYVDTAHKKLFGILWKVMDLLAEQDYEKNKYACVEAIKFLYNYTATHFAQEEAFMREIGYSGYEAHRKVHEEIKNQTVPMHDKVLTESDYSKEAVREFIAFFTGWLTGHILVMDRAITDSSFEDINEANISVTEKIIKDIEGFTNRFCNYRFMLSTLSYDGNIYEDAVYYKLTYEAEELLFMTQSEVVKKMVGQMAGKSIESIDKAALISFIQLMLYAGRLVYYSLSAKIADKPESHSIIAAKDAKAYIENKKISNYVEWEAADGKIAIFVLK